MTGTTVKWMRTRMGLTQVELAQRLGVSQSLVFKWEAGVRVCRGPAQRLLESEFEAHVGALKKARKKV